MSVQHTQIAHPNRVQQWLMRNMGILFYKNFGAQQISWLNFFITTATVMGIVTVLLSGLAIGYFWRKERSVTSPA